MPSIERLAVWVTHYGYEGIFVLLMLGIVGLPVPDEWLLTFAGFLVAQGTLKFPPALASAFLGSCCGITLSYILGRFVGHEALTGHLRLLHLGKQQVQRAHRWFEQAGRWALTLGYFVPGIRHLTALLAGAGQLAPRTFALFAYSGALIWSVSFITLGYYMGRDWERVLRNVRLPVIVGALIVFVVAALYLRRKRNPGESPGHRGG